MENELINDQTKYYEPTLGEIIKALNRMYEELDYMEIKWTKEKGFETCILNFGN